MKTFFLFLTLSTFLFAQNNEFRATWVITWEHINRFETAEQNKARVRKILDDHVDANMNAVLWQARQSGTAYYQSSYEPWGYYAGYSYPGYDPLGYAIEEAHKRGLELHAWFNVFHVSSSFPGTIASEHPEWICTNIDGDFMTSYKCASPGIAAVREYTINVAMEIVRNYDIDGLHLDFVRWNEYDEDDMKGPLTEEEQISILDGVIINKKMQANRNTEGVKRYIFDADHPYSAGVPSGFNNWDDWRRWGVTEFVKTLHDSIQSVKPYVRLTPAALGKYRSGGVNGWNGYYVVFQDAALWFNEGYVDQLTPMHYHWTSGASMVASIISDWEPYIQDGINEGRLYTVGPGSYVLLENNVWYKHPDIVNTCRTLDYVDGFQFFSYGTWDDQNYFTDAAREFFTGKTKVRSIVSETPPDAPTISIIKVDSLNYDITVTPAVSTSDNGWYAIYRSEDNNFDLDTDQIIRINFGNSPFTYQEDFSDAIFYSGTYKYFATALNRYWNESDVSNMVESDSVSIAAPAPSTPNFYEVQNVDQNTLLLTCEPEEFAAGYTAYYGTDGETFPDSTVSAGPNIFVSGLTENTVYYFKVRAFNNRGYSELTNRLFAGVPSANPHQVLIVNGFDRTTNSRLDYIRFYADPVNDAGYPFSYTLNDAVIGDQVDLTDFETVVWVLGDESTADETFSDIEQQKVMTFLRGGGNLFVSGAEVAWDLQGSSSHSATDVYFLNQFLKAKYIADAPGGSQSTYYMAQPIAGGIFNGISNFNFDNGTHGTFDVDWPDAIDGLNGGTPCMLYSGAPASSNIAGVNFKGMFPAGIEPGALIYLAFPFETVYTDNYRMQIMEKAFNYFYPSTYAEETVGNLPVDYTLYQNYPNPFNPTTKIRFYLKDAGNVKLTVFNLLGETVINLADEDLPAGMYSYDFDASNLSSGLYIYRIEVKNKFADSKKMLLLK